MAQIQEQTIVEAIVSKLPAEAFSQAVLHRLALSLVVPIDLAILLLFQHRFASQFGAIVASDHAGAASHLGNLV